jgi:hypothetical protein
MPDATVAGDDLDAPDICAPAPVTGPLGKARMAGSGGANGRDRPALDRNIDGPGEDWSGRPEAIATRQFLTPQPQLAYR